MPRSKNAKQPNVRKKDGEKTSTDLEKEQRLVVTDMQLEDRVSKLENLLCEARQDCARESKDCEQAHEAYRILQSKYEEMKKSLEAEKSDLAAQVKTLRGTVKDMGSLLSEAHRECNKLTKAMEERQKTVEELQKSNFHLKAEYSDVTAQAKMLRDTVKDLVTDTQRNYEDQAKDCEREREAHHILQAENDELKKKMNKKKGVWKRFWNFIKNVD